MYTFFIKIVDIIKRLVDTFKCIEPSISLMAHGNSRSGAHRSGKILENNAMTVSTRLHALVLVAAALTFAVPAQADTQLRFLSQFLPTAKQYPAEKQAVETIAADASLGMKVLHKEYKSLGLKFGDGLRILRSGSFDVVTVQIGNASRDDPFLEGLDLIGVSTDMASLRDAVNAYREVFDARLQQKFNGKVLGLWPFGPQVFYCNQPIKTLDDLKGLKVRSFTPTMSALLDHFGATAVTLSFPEVYPALQRNVASCGVTSPTSGNTGKWPEVTTHQLPLSVSGSVQGYFANLDWWNSLSSAQQAGVTKAFKSLEDSQWNLAGSGNGDAMACNTGQESCKDHQKFSMELVKVSDSDIQRVKDAAREVVLPGWFAKCEKSYEGCTDVWYDTVGKARGITR
jgi:TRAP-type C4-dicarboxylate transport system substrate-binding protein